ncbi:hypothetical protein Bbelb_059980 [Branchiostoma belcheri]|nr:hypothetical protein Bbelb_059980 [Branchiostoma belcheri]
MDGKNERVKIQLRKTRHVRFGATRVICGREGRFAADGVFATERRFRAPTTRNLLSEAKTAVAKTDWTRSDDLLTQEEYQYSEDYCLDLTREDWTRSGDLETQEQEQQHPEVYMCAEAVQSGRNLHADLETGLQQEEEPDFCRQGCVKEDGEE